MNSQTVSGLPTTHEARRLWNDEVEFLIDVIS
jgi:hypothetical protein